MTEACTTRRAGGRTALPALLLAALCALAFWPVLRQGFVGLDVEDYLTGNPNVLGGLTWRGAAWAFTTPHAANWHPLTWLSHMADVELFGLDPRGHHLVNLLLHAVNAMLLFLVLQGLTGARWRSAFVAALFAVHPLHVESVAWVAARKDTLSTLLLLCTLAAYLRFVRRPGRVRFLPVTALFALGLLAKPMLVTLPFLLLLLDFWPLDRLAFAGDALGPGAGLPRRLPWRQALLEKLPLFVLSFASSVVTFAVQSRWGAVQDLDRYPLPERAANALLSCVAYVAKALWPSGLAVYYPFREGLPSWQPLGAGLLLTAASVAVFAWRGTRPHLACGWLWYVGTLVPVIGLVQVGSQAMADRYTYLPLIGLLVMAAWEAPRIAGERSLSHALLAAGALSVVVACTAAARVQVGYWRDDVALYEHAIRVTEGNWKAHFNLGHALQRQGKLGEARAHYAEAARLRPGYRATHPGFVPSASAAYSQGLALLAQGDAAQAAARFSEAERADPSDPRPPYSLGVALSRAGRLDEAVAGFERSLRLEPGSGRAHNDLGAALLGLGRVDEAIRHFREANRLNPRDAQPLYNLGVTLHRLGREEEAVASFSGALAADPAFEPAKRMLSGGATTR